MEPVKKCPSCAMNIPPEAYKCPYCRKTIKTSPIAIAIAGSILLVVLVGMCSTSCNNQQPTSYAPAQSKSFNRGFVSCSNKYDTITTYAVFMGRAVACGERIDKPLEYVGYWIDDCFDQSEIASQLAVFSTSVRYHAENQKNGNTPDSCTSVVNTFYSVNWPDNKMKPPVHQAPQSQPDPTPISQQPLPITTDKMPYIDKEKGIDTTK